MEIPALRFGGHAILGYMEVPALRVEGCVEILAGGTALCAAAAQLRRLHGMPECPVYRVLSARRCGGVEQLQCTCTVSSVQSTLLVAVRATVVIV